MRSQGVCFLSWRGAGSNSHCSDFSVAKRKVRVWRDTVHPHHYLSGSWRMQWSTQSDDMRKGCKTACILLGVRPPAFAMLLYFPCDHQSHPFVRQTRAELGSGPFSSLGGIVASAAVDTAQRQPSICQPKKTKTESLKKASTKISQNNMQFLLNINNLLQSILLLWIGLHLLFCKAICSSFTKGNLNVLT